VKATTRWSLARAAENFHHAGGRAKSEIGLALAMRVSIATASRYVAPLLADGLIEVVEKGDQGLDAQKATIFAATAKLRHSLRSLSISRDTAMDERAENNADVESVPQFRRQALEQIRVKVIRRRPESSAERQARNAATTAPSLMVDVTVGGEWPEAVCRIARYLDGTPDVYDAAEDRWSDRGRFGATMLALTRWAWGHGPFTTDQAATALGVPARTLRDILRRLEPADAKHEGDLWLLTIKPVIPYEALNHLLEWRSDLNPTDPMQLLLGEILDAFGFDPDEGVITEGLKQQARSKRKKFRDAKGRASAKEQAAAVAATDTAATYEPMTEIQPW
jgi:hypothetical protein